MIAMLLRKLLLVCFASIAVLAAAEQINPTAPPLLMSRLVAGSAPVTIQHSGVLNSPEAFREVIPPERYQEDGATVVIFGHADVIAKLCGGSAADGLTPLACQGRVENNVSVMALPNPCIFAQEDFYAAIVCHELGHMNGWIGEHGD